MDTQFFSAVATTRHAGTGAKAAESSITSWQESLRGRSIGVFLGDTGSVRVLACEAVDDACGRTH